MVDIILNPVATGNWDTLGPGVGFPQNAFEVTLKARTNVAMQYKFANRDPYMTIPAGNTVTLKGSYDPGELQVLAANGVVFEIHISTNPRLIR